MKPLIQDIRMSKGLMQKFVAQQMKMSQQQLSDWEHGRAYPRIDKAYKLANILGVKVNELYEENSK
jgi:transcriptional regulator with XRE-family HTH domain